MTTSLQISSPEEAQELIDATKAIQEAERNAAAEKRPSTSINTASTASVAISDGHMSVTSGRPTSASARDQEVKPGQVKLSNGVVTTLKAAQAAGLTGMIVERSEDDQQSFKAGPSQTPDQTDPKTESEQDTPLDGATEDEKAQITKANEAVSKAREAIGATAAQSMQHDVVVSGVLPTELPQGLTEDMVNAVADGYVAQANAVLRDTGATVDALTAFLNENELRDARAATFRGDDAKLKSLGRRAVSRLQSLPKDPVLFKELTAGWPETVKIVRRGNLTWVETPNWKMPWSQAVSSGKIRF